MRSGKHQMSGQLIHVRPAEAPGGAALSCIIEDRASGPAYIVTVRGQYTRATFVFHDREELRAFADRVTAGTPLEGAAG